jgi:hypothetical protein
MLTVALSHAVVESAVIASVRGFRPHVAADAVVDRDRSVPAQDDRPFARQAKLSENRAKSSCNRVRLDISSVEETF